MLCRQSISSETWRPRFGTTTNDWTARLSRWPRRGGHSVRCAGARSGGCVRCPDKRPSVSTSVMSTAEALTELWRSAGEQHDPRSSSRHSAVLDRGFTFVRRGEAASAASARDHSKSCGRHDATWWCPSRWSTCYALATGFRIRFTNNTTVPTSAALAPAVCLVALGGQSDSYLLALAPTAAVVLLLATRRAVYEVVWHVVLFGLVAATVHGLGSWA